MPRKRPAKLKPPRERPSSQTGPGPSEEDEILDELRNREPAPAPPPAPDAPAELKVLEQDIAKRFPEPPPPPPPAAEPAPGAPAPDDEMVDGLDALAERPELLDDLSDEDLADLWDLAFGLVADWRGDYWQLNPKSAGRLGKWSKRVLVRHPQILAYLAKNLPDLVLAFLLAVEIGRKVALDRKAHHKLEVVA